jgi:hypothetical protein
MRIDSSGNLGIGTSSPAEKLHVNSGVGNVPLLLESTDPVAVVQFKDSDSTLFNAVGVQANALIFYSADNVNMRLDSSGNLGLGVTPSAWSAGKAIQVGEVAVSLWGISGNTVLGNNSYFSSGDKYATTSGASQYAQFNGAHKWYTAPSGTAGDAISFTQAMTLSAAGDLLVGQTGLLFGPSNAKSLELNGTAGSTLVLNAAGALGSYIFQDSSNLKITNYQNGFVSFGTNNTERARITSGGDLLVGTTSAYTFSSGVITAGQLGATTDAVGNHCAQLWNQATSGDNLFVTFFTESSGSPVQRGSISYNRAGGLVAYNVTSDYRAKDIIGPVTNSGALIDSVPVYMGKMKGATQERPMFIAHEVPAYAHTGVKDAVDADGKPVYQQMDASALIPVMWAEIQSLRARLAAANI